MISKEDCIKMYEQRKRLFNYTKLINDIQQTSAKSQENLSVNLDCTATHICNVKRQKSSFSLDKTLMLLNEYDYCIDNYVETNNTKVMPMYEARKLFHGLNSELQLVLTKLAEEMVKVIHKKPTENYPCLNQEERKSKIAKRIRQIRLEKKISVEAMCRRTQIKKATYQNIENGSNGTTLENYIRIADALQVPVGFLLRDVLKNKDTLIDYSLKQLFSMVNFREQKRLEEMMEEISLVIIKYSNL